MLQDKINKDYIEAMKARDTIRSSTLNFLKSQLKYIIIDKKTDPLSDEDVMDVIKKQIKQRQDSIEQFRLGKREDLVAKESAELAILKSYLPQGLTLEVLEKLVRQVIMEEQAQSLKDMGRVMKAVLSAAKGKADNQQVSELVKKALSVPSVK